MVPLLIESTASYAGKTMICLGLGLTFQKDGFSVSYFKPFGRSPVREGKITTDEDAVLIRNIFNLEEQLSVLDPEDKETGGMTMGLKKRLKRRRNQQKIIRQRMRELDPNYKPSESKPHFKYKTDEEVRNAFINGELTEEEAAQILRSTFSYE